MVLYLLWFCFDVRPLEKSAFDELEPSWKNGADPFSPKPIHGGGGLDRRHHFPVAPSDVRNIHKR